LTNTLKPIFDLQKNTHFKFVSSFSDKPDFVAQFRKKFNSIRAYHATNLNKEEISDVKKNGLKIPNREFLIQKAFLKLSRKDDPESLKFSIADSAKKYFDSNDYFLEQQIFFGLIKAPFIDDYYHYLLFGSELF